MQQASLRLSMARDRGQTGSRRAGERADRASEGWTERAAYAIWEHAGCGERFLIEDVAFGYPWTPPDPRAWGHATRLAVKRGWIKKVGYAPAASSNGSPKCLWAKA